MANSGSDSPMMAKAPEGSRLDRGYGANAPRRGIGVVAQVLLAGCIAGALLGSRPLVTWAENKPDAPDWLVQTLRDWDSALTWTGLAELHSVVRHSVEKARAVTFQPSP
jgi:hypothetical protein